jgi:hypothetical protein
VRCRIPWRILQADTALQLALEQQWRWSLRNVAVARRTHSRFTVLKKTRVPRGVTIGWVATGSLRDFLGLLHVVFQVNFSYFSSDFLRCCLGLHELDRLRLGRGLDPLKDSLLQQCRALVTFHFILTGGTVHFQVQLFLRNWSIRIFDTSALLLRRLWRCLLTDVQRISFLLYGLCGC